MWKPIITDADLSHAEAERERADRLYNEALTALDQALAVAPAPLAPPPSYDERQITPLNQSWGVVPADPLAGLTGWRRRLAGLTWGLVGPLFQRQQSFNAALVDHLNRNVGVHRATRDAIEALSARLSDSLGLLERFEARLIACLQQVTLYVDTKDRDEAAAIRYRLQKVEQRAVGLAGGLSGLGDELRKRLESVTVGSARTAARVAAIESASGAGSRPVLATTGAAAGEGGAAVPGAATAPGAATRWQAGSAFSSPSDAGIYVGFEELFRGPREDIRLRLVDYLPLFAGATDIVEVGCGRGEFLELLREQGIGGRGVDANPEMVRICQARDLDVVEGDAVGYLEALADASVGGLFAAQVVEHFEPRTLVGFLDAARRKLRPGAPLVIETINPQCWSAFFDSYIRDITHVRPIHPDTLTFLLGASGFEQIEVSYRAPYPEAGKLRRAGAFEPGGAPSPELGRLADLAATIDANVDRLNGLLFTHLDYAAVAVRPRE